MIDLLPRLLVIAMALSLCCASSAAAEPTPRVTLDASFHPNRLGKSTTVVFGVRIAAGAGAAPSPLSGISLLLPAHMGLALTTLGLANCYPEALLAHGLAGCSPNARIGSGTATAEVPLGLETIRETVRITALAGPPTTDRVPLLFYAQGSRPVIADLVFSGSLGEFLTTTIPPTPTLPDAAEVSVVSFRSSIGPAGLTYRLRVHNRMVSFHPTGMVVPVRCPAEGFPFSVSLSFQDGTRATARTSVPCPAVHPHPAHPHGVHPRRQG